MIFFERTPEIMGVRASGNKFATIKASNNAGNHRDPNGPNGNKNFRNTLQRCINIHGCHNLYNVQALMNQFGIRCITFYISLGLVFISVQIRVLLMVLLCFCKNIFFQMQHYIVKLKQKSRANELSYRYTYFLVLHKFFRSENLHFLTNT